MSSHTQFSQWQLTGNTAQAYENYLVPAIFRAGAAQLVDLANIQPGERVLDVGCGTGIVARTAAERTGAAGFASGLDLNPGMLEVAREASQDSAHRIEWRQGTAEEMPFARSSFDVILSQQAFQFLGDRSQALTEMRRVLAPGGRAVVSVLRSIEHNRTYRPVIEAFARHGGSDLGAMMEAPFQRWSRDELRELALGAGFESVSVTLAVIPARFPSIPEFLQWELSSSPLSEVVASMQQETRSAIIRDVEAGLKDYVDDEGVFHPLQTYVVVAR
jgi:ubiquinone/menaquinone biosynthesis C-methylase UbiE